MTKCHFYWTTHGCDLGEGHEGMVHQCQVGDQQPCSKYNEETGQRCDWDDEVSAWEDWEDNGMGFRDDH